MTKPNKPYDTTPRLDPSIQGLYPSFRQLHWQSIIMYVYQTFLTNFGGLYLTEFLTDFGQILDSNSYDQAQQTL